MLSYWDKEFWWNHVDYCIVGSGIVGLNTAMHLSELNPKARIAVLERGFLPYGASTRNAGFACFGTIGELLDDLEHQDEEEVIETIRMRWQGLQRLLELVPASKMQFSYSGGYELVDSDAEFAKYEGQLNRINEMMEQATGRKHIISVSNHNPGNSFYRKSFFNPHEGQLNPGLMIRYLLDILEKRGVRIVNGFELTSYVEDKDVRIQSKDGSELTCGKLILCTNAFTNQVYEKLNVIPARNLVILTKPIPELEIDACYHYNKGYTYFRNVGNRILLGGGRNIDPETETTDKAGVNPVILDYLKTFLARIVSHEVIPDIEYRWSGIIATGESKKPIIRKVGDNIYAGVRLGGMGVAIGSLVGKTLAELVFNDTY